MSTVYLHVGQCGVQVGKEYWKDVVSKSQQSKSVKRTHFTSSGPRALFIDAERKVIQKFIEETKSSKVGLLQEKFNSSGSRVDRASASRDADSGDSESGLISSLIKSITLKLVFAASLLDAQH